MLCVVSGQTVVHSESSKPSMTTLPRNWLSDIGWPNWLTSLISGAGREFSELPRSRFGFISAAVEAGLACMPPSEPVLLALAPHPASAVSTLSRAAAASVPRVRNVFIARNSLLRSTTTRRRGWGRRRAWVGSRLVRGVGAGGGGGNWGRGFRDRRRRSRRRRDPRPGSGRSG